MDFAASVPLNLVIMDRRQISLQGLNKLSQGPAFKDFLVKSLSSRLHGQYYLSMALIPPHSSKFNLVILAIVFPLHSTRHSHTLT